MLIHLLLRKDDDKGNSVFHTKRSRFILKKALFPSEIPDNWIRYLPLISVLPLLFVICIQILHEMKTTRHLPVLLALVAVLFSCDKPQPEASSLLEQAEQMIEVDLDSALVLIDSIYYPEKSFNTEDYLRYVVRRVQIRHKNYLPVSEDTLVFDAEKYFTTKSRDPELTSLACYYSGCVRREQGDLHQAMEDYKEALSYSSNTSNDALKGMIQYNLGELFEVHGLFEEALDHYLLAEQIYRQSPGDYRDKEVHCRSEIGRKPSVIGVLDCFD